MPRKIVTDNGTAFTSNEFCKFMERNGIKHVTSAPYHPSTNGLAERAVQTFKRAIQRLSDLPIQERLSKFFFSYRLTPHTTTGVAPAELLMGRRPRSLLDNLHPDLSQRVEHRQAKQKQSHDTSKPLRNFVVGDTVFAENFTGTLPKWLSGVIAEVTGPLSYVVKLSDGATVRRHVDAIRRRDCSPTDSSEDSPAPVVPLSVALSTQPAAPTVPPPPVPPDDHVPPPPAVPPVSTTPATRVPPTRTTTRTAITTGTTSTTQPSVRRSTRSRKPREFYQGI